VAIIGIGVAIAVAIGFCRPIQPIATAIATAIPIPIPADMVFSSLFDAAKCQPTYELIGNIPFSTPCAPCADMLLAYYQAFIYPPAREDAKNNEYY